MYIIFLFVFLLYLCGVNKKISFLLILVLCFPLSLSAEELWQWPVVNHERKDYHSGNQNWMVAQSRQGWMYFANNKGLLEFDGARWTTYPLPGNAKVRSVFLKGDTIYVGALGQFGRFTRNSKGGLIYTRLSKPVEQARKLNVWHIFQLGSDVYFQSDDALYVNDENHQIHSVAGIYYSAVVYNKLYVVTSVGLSVLAGGRLQPLKGFSADASTNVVGLHPYDGKLLIVTADNRLLLYSQQTVTPFQVAIGVTGNDRLTCSAISGHHLALGTMQNGVILVDLKRNTSQRLSISDGLQNKSILSAAFDINSDLWLGLDNGIDCVLMQSPLRFLYNRKTPIGSGYCSVEYNGSLWLGTNQGLYVIHPDKPSEIRFVEGTSTQIHCLDTIDGRLFCGGRNIFIMIDQQGIKRFQSRGVWGVRRIGARRDVLLTSSYWGLRLLRFVNGQWQLGEEVEGTSLSAKTLYVEEPTNAVWVANKEKGLFRLTLNDDLTRVTRQQPMNSAQLPKGDNVCIATVDGETVIASRNGLFRYDTAHEKLVRYGQLEKRLGGSTVYTFIQQDSEGNIWYAANEALHCRTAKTNDSWLEGNLIEDFENISLDAARQHAVIGTEDGFTMLSTTSHAVQKKMMQPYIRKIYVGNYADTLYYGCESPVEIAWRDNSVRIEYSACNYDVTRPVLFSYRLKGNGDESWSPYTHRMLKEYTNLHEGHYTFELRMLLPGQSESAETSFSFDVLPPWYRTWWARLLYLLFFLACFAFVYHKINKSQQQLIRQKDDQIQEKEKKIEILRDEKLEMELRSRQDELLRSRMNIVRKNEMLIEIKKTAVSLNNSLNEENMPTSKRRILRLISQIETNLEHDDDLDAFKDSFNDLHNNFLQILDKRYPALTRKEKMLCCYIRMNLISKEIAPLLNISTRGVEISRYRIRQKLDLDSKTSLTEFLQRL